MTHTKMAFASRDYSFQGPTQSAMHSTRSQRLVQDTNTMALLTSADSTKMSCKQLNASDNRLQTMSNMSRNQCMQLLHVLELEKAACQPSALWISSASCNLNFIGADEYAWWPGVGHEAAANKGHGKEVPRAAGFRQEARNGHGMHHGMSAMVWKKRGERRCVVCRVAEGCCVRVRSVPEGLPRRFQRL